MNSGYLTADDVAEFLGLAPWAPDSIYVMSMAKVSKPVSFKTFLINHLYPDQMARIRTGLLLKF